MNNLFALFFKDVDNCLSFTIPVRCVVVKFDAFGVTE